VARRCTITLYPLAPAKPLWRYFFEACMARITVEDCLSTIDNRFELSLAAAVRARQLAGGHQPLVDSAKRDKPVVVALREIAGQKVDRSVLKKIGV